MAILKNPSRKKFTVVDNHALRDDNLSLKARGLLVTMLSLPNNWKFSENGLCELFKKDGQASIRSGLKELESSGYLVRRRTRDDMGRVDGVEWIIYDQPRLENRNVDNPSLDSQPQLNTNQSKTKESNTEREKRKRFTPPTLEEVSAYCRELNSKIDPQQFIDYYTANGWVQGKGKPIKDWKAAVRTWNRRENKPQGNTVAYRPQEPMYREAK